MGALAMSEPEAGSDVVAMKTRAEKKGIIVRPFVYPFVRTSLTDTHTSSVRETSSYFS